MAGKLLTMRQACEELGLSPRTLRYYEELDFLRPVRSAGGHRLYGDEDLNILGRIARMQAVGLSLRTIGKALGYRSHRDETTGRRRFDAATLAALSAEAREDVALLRARIVELRRELEAAEGEADELERDAAYLESRYAEELDREAGRGPRT